MKTEIALANENGELSYRGYQRRAAEIVDGRNTESIEFSGVGGGTGVTATHVEVHLNGNVRSIPLTVPIFLFRGVHPCFPVGALICKEDDL